MNKYAIINIGGKQLKVTEGETFRIERQKALNIKVIAYYNGTEVVFGNPFLTDVKVEATLVEDKLAPKVVVQRFKAKSRHHRKKGHRQPISVVRIDSILRGEEKPTVKAVKVVKEPKVVKVDTEKKESAKTTTKSKAAVPAKKTVEKTTKPVKRVSKVKKEDK